MNQPLNWEKLLSKKRVGQECVDKGFEADHRTAFNIDYDKIIFSSAFRRLQDKTQVFPLDNNDYVRTRLTHTLEVTSVGRSLGILAAKIIFNDQPDLEKQITHQDIGSIVAAACLAHDIGNPPFGHAGESAIQEWFHARGINNDIDRGAQRQDFFKFEGNAQGFRVLCSPQNSHRFGGMQLTCAVLGAFAKYPRASEVDKKQETGISGKKFSFMHSEAKIFEEIAVELGLNKKPGNGAAWYRHPLAFLVEAADDICYHIIDVEDGFKRKLISFDEVFELYRPFVEESKIKNLLQIEDEFRKIEYLRAITINYLVNEASDVFAKNYKNIMHTKFDCALMETIEKSKEFKAFKDLAIKKVYSARPVLEIEACGFEVIGGLLDFFVNALEVKTKVKKGGRRHAETIFNLMPKLDDLSSSYQRFLYATDYVSGMTDSFAVQLYQRIKGISLP